ncbi:MetQ/NlpA family ABC transporter substrate-binding protein [Brevibacterium pityocampae]|uniref:MetQ/NlpA family ABC transporter substrate-binding protein n=1 Tax=Brevibacterium pityocampae TaxID=506594 RepID=A0ABP8J2N6_9MICO
MTRPTTHSWVKTALSLSAAGLLLSVAACGGGAASAEGPDDVLTIGTDDGQEKHWLIIQEKLAEGGIEAEVKTFSDGTQINTATENGDIDINLFQHLAYLAQYNVNNNGTLVPVGATAVYPLALYSKDYGSLEELPEGAEVAIPNNPTNQARALLNLQEAGLLTLKDGGDSLSTPAEIESAKVEITPVDSNQTVTALNGSAAAAVVNNTQAQKGGLGDEVIIYKDDLESGTNDAYINAFVTKEENADDPRWETLIDVYHSSEVQEAVTELNGGNLKFKDDWTAEQLVELLRSEEEVAASGA